MSSRRMGSSKMALKYIVMYCDTLCENLTHYPLHWDLHWALLSLYCYHLYNTCTEHYLWEFKHRLFYVQPWVHHESLQSKGGVSSSYTSCSFSTLPVYATINGIMKALRPTTPMPLHSWWWGEGLPLWWLWLTLSSRDSAMVEIPSRPLCSSRVTPLLKLLQKLEKLFPNFEASWPFETEMVDTLKIFRVKCLQYQAGLR